MPQYYKRGDVDKMGGLVNPIIYKMCHNNYWNYVGHERNQDHRNLIVTLSERIFRKRERYIRDRLMAIYWGHQVVFFATNKVSFRIKFSRVHKGRWYPRHRLSFATNPRDDIGWFNIMGGLRYILKGWIIRRHRNRYLDRIYSLRNQKLKAYGGKHADGAGAIAIFLTNERLKKLRLAQVDKAKEEGWFMLAVEKRWLILNDDIIDETIYRAYITLVIMSGWYRYLKRHRRRYLKRFRKRVRDNKLRLRSLYDMYRPKRQMAHVLEQGLRSLQEAEAPTEMMRKHQSIHTQYDRIVWGLWLQGARDVYYRLYQIFFIIPLEHERFYKENTVFRAVIKILLTGLLYNNQRLTTPTEIEYRISLYRYMYSIFSSDNNSESLQNFIRSSRVIDGSKWTIYENLNFGSSADLDLKKKEIALLGLNERIKYKGPSRKLRVGRKHKRQGLLSKRAFMKLQKHLRVPARKHFKEKKTIVRGRKPFSGERAIGRRQRRLARAINGWNRVTNTVGLKYQFQYSATVASNRLRVQVFNYLRSQFTSSTVRSQITIAHYLFENERLADEIVELTHLRDQTMTGTEAYTALQQAIDERLELIARNKKIIEINETQLVKTNYLNTLLSRSITHYRSTRSLMLFYVGAGTEGSYKLRNSKTQMRRLPRPMYLKEGLKKHMTLYRHLYKGYRRYRRDTGLSWGRRGKTRRHLRYHKVLRRAWSKVRYGDGLAKLLRINQKSAKKIRMLKKDKLQAKRDVIERRRLFCRQIKLRLQRARCRANHFKRNKPKHGRLRHNRLTHKKFKQSLTTIDTKLHRIFKRHCAIQRRERVRRARGRREPHVYRARRRFKNWQRKKYMFSKASKAVRRVPLLPLKVLSGQCRRHKIYRLKRGKLKMLAFYSQASQIDQDFLTSVAQYKKFRERIATYMQIENARLERIRRNEEAQQVKLEQEAQRIISAWQRYRPAQISLLRRLKFEYYTETQFTRHEWFETFPQAGPRYAHLQRKKVLYIGARRRLCLMDHRLITDHCNILRRKYYYRQVADYATSLVIKRLLGNIGFLIGWLTETIIDFELRIYKGIKGVRAESVAQFLKMKSRKAYTVNSLMFGTIRFIRRGFECRGYRLEFCGRFLRRGRATYRWHKYGKLERRSVSGPMEYSWKSLVMKYGVSSIKVWVLKHSRHLYINDIVGLVRQGNQSGNYLIANRRSLHPRYRRKRHRGKVVRIPRKPRRRRRRKPKRVRRRRKSRKLGRLLTPTKLHPWQPRGLHPVKSRHTATGERFRRRRKMAFCGVFSKRRRRLLNRMICSNIASARYLNAFPEKRLHFTGVFQVFYPKLHRGIFISSELQKLYTARYQRAFVAKKQFELFDKHFEFTKHWYILETVEPSVEFYYLRHMYRGFHDVLVSIAAGKMQLLYNWFLNSELSSPQNWPADILTSKQLRAMSYHDEVFIKTPNKWYRRYGFSFFMYPGINYRIEAHTLRQCDIYTRLTKERLPHLNLYVKDPEIIDNLSIEAEKILGVDRDFIPNNHNELLHRTNEESTGLEQELTFNTYQKFFAAHTKTMLRYILGNEYEDE